jgi:glycosyltransferase involved in cell wall biosynthesis
MYRTADHICFSSNWTASDFRRLEGFEPQSWSTVPLAGWPDDFVYHPPSSREQIGVVVASADARDEIGWALDVWRLAALPGPWTLVVIGSVCPVLCPGVQYYGWIPDTKMADTLARARFYLHVGRVEGFGFSVIEALQLGTPVVARRGSAVDELLDRGGGYLVEDASDASQAVVALAGGAVSPNEAKSAASRYDWFRTANAVAIACQKAYATR